MKKKIFVISFCILATWFPKGSYFTDAEEYFEKGLTLQLDESNTVNDKISFAIDHYVTSGNVIGIKMSPKDAIDQNGNVPAWSMFQIEVQDEDNNKYYTRQTHGETTSSGVYLPAFDETGNYCKVTYGYSFIWPKLGFYGTIYLPYEQLSTNDGKTLTKGTSITSISLVHNSKTNARKKMTTHLFSLTDATLNEIDTKETWIGDVKVLQSFDKILGKQYLNEEKIILNLSELEPNSSLISYSNNCKMYLRETTEEEIKTLKAIREDVDATWKSNYATNGQKFEFYSANNQEYHEALIWKYGSYLEDYDSSLNAYGSLNIPVSTSNWKNALGLTLYVKNYQSYPSSFNLEFVEKEEGGNERWNLNGSLYRKIYAYDVNTNEEFAFYSLVVCELPANFEGWIRIPFSEYNCPDWNLAYDYSDGILDFDKEHTVIYLTSMFAKNDQAKFLFDNIGLYYEDFEVGKLFDRSKLSIRECLQLENYKGDES